MSSNNDQRPAIEVEHLDFAYGEKQVLSGIDMKIRPRQVTAFIGPSGCGKSTLLHTFNRLSDLVPSARICNGHIRVLGKDIHDPDVDPTQLRKKVGMVFQKYNPFPKSIYENVAFGIRVDTRPRGRLEIDEVVESSLRGAALWDEVKDRMHDSALSLSGGQQQRLCIARAIANKPEILLMDEPCAALDPGSTLRVEQLINELKEDYTIVIVTHNMNQATRVSDWTAFLYMGELIEYDRTMSLFQHPTEDRTRAYISGLFS
jgi:phosphate transport system ATP-binding protein